MSDALESKVKGRAGMMKRCWMRRRRRRRECAEGNHNWPGSGRWRGAVAGWNMCVCGGGVRITG